MPVENFIKSQTLLYFTRLYTTKLNPLLKESFLLCQNLDSQGIYTWFSYAKSIIDETGLDILQLQNTTSSNQVKLPKKYVKSTLKFYYENLINNKLSKLDQKSKLYLFSNLKQNLSVESYLSISNFEYRKLITKLRISEHNLLIEKGRHLNIPREQRLCSHCKCIDDEKHFLLHCTINSELRSSFLNILNNENQIFNNLSESEKLSYILNPSTPSQVNKLGSFLKKKVIRTEDRGLLTYLLENVDFMFSLLHVYLYNLYNCHKLYCLMTITF